LKIKLLIPVLLLLVVTLAAQSSSKSKWKTVYRDNTGDHITGMEFVSPAHGFVLTMWTLLETIDAGKTWIKRVEAPQWNLSLTFGPFSLWDAQNMWILGHQNRNPKEKWDGFIWITHDSGQSWNKILLPSVTRIMDSHFCSQNIGWVIGEIHPTDLAERDSCILRTIDGGQTWTEMIRSYGADKQIQLIACFNCDEALALREDGVILHTQDAGKSWVERDLHIKTALYKIRIFENEAWIVGIMGTVIKSTDRGVTWKRVPIKGKGIPKDAMFTDILMLGNRGWLLEAYSDYILSTQDGGISWKPEDSDKAIWLSFLYAKGDSVWAVGQPATILHKDNK
jgi:photosystem II stability/assembly factor-like uncharacterized protein